MRDISDDIAVFYEMLSLWEKTTNIFLAYFSK